LSRFVANYIIRFAAMSNLGSFILAIDTTSRHGSIAIARDGGLRALLGLESDSQQSAVLWTDIDLLLGRLGATIDDVTAFAVARGPGAFTGLRVGLAAAAGLARATGRPLYGATSLELVARASGPAERVWVVLNAYRNEVYAQPFRVEPDGEAVPIAEPVVAAPAALFARFEPGPLRVTGSGVAVYRDLLDAEAAARGAAWRVVPAPPFLAGELAMATAARIASGAEAGRVDPCYVRQSEAEINLKLGRLEGAGTTRTP
jgi:tRNA threonylcarbamoyladenosine biosynthesis protein TsaB